MCQPRKYIFLPTAKFAFHTDGIFDLSACPNLEVSLIASASADMRALLWSAVASQEPPLLSLKHRGSVNSARFHPSRPLLCTASGECFGFVWDLRALFDSRLRAKDKKKHTAAAATPSLTPTNTVSVRG